MNAAIRPFGRAARLRGAAPRGFRATALLLVALAVWAQPANAQSGVSESHLGRGGTHASDTNQSVPLPGEGGAGIPEFPGLRLVDPTDEGEGTPDAENGWPGEADGRIIPLTPEMIRRLGGNVDEFESGGTLASGADGNRLRPAESGGGNPAFRRLRTFDPLATGRETSDEKVEGFNDAIDRAFPMTPEMIRRYREIFEENERAALGRPEPRAETSSALVSLAPGEPAPLLRVSPSIASVISFHDVTGSAWPIAEYVLGNDEDFEAQHLGGNSNNIVLTPGARVGFTNLVVVLEEHDRPVTIRISVDGEVADHRFDVQMTRPGPRAAVNDAVGATREIAEAGDGLLLAAIGGVDMPGDAKPVAVAGADVRGWILGDDLYLRSRHPLMSPSWTGSMVGPNGVRAYRMDPVSAALFSVDGRIVRAEIMLP